MKYAIVEIQGLQVFLNDNIPIYLSLTPSLNVYYVIFNKILLFRVLNQLYIGQPYAYNLPLQLLGRLINSVKKVKLQIVKLKSKKKYRKKMGYKHRFFTYLPIFKSF